MGGLSASARALSVVGVTGGCNGGDSLCVGESLGVGEPRRSDALIAVVNRTAGVATCARRALQVHLQGARARSVRRFFDSCQPHDAAGEPVDAKAA